VIDVDFGEQAIIQAVNEAVSPEFKATCEGWQHFFGDGHASEKIIDLLLNAPDEDRLLNKTFYDLTHDAA